MEQPLRVGIIGSGLGGSGHAAAYSQIPGVKVAGLWSRNRARAEKLKAKLDMKGLQVFNHWEEMIEQGNLDLVSVATPPTLRPEPIIAALESGLHVLVEKPFTIELPEARQLAEAARHSDTVTTVSFNWRYAPGWQAARRAVQEGTIGQVLGISSVWYFRFTGDLGAAFASRPWTMSTKTGGGMIRQLGSHEFDLARFVTGLEFTRVVGRLPALALPGMDNDGACLLLAELSSGGLGDFRVEITPGQAEHRMIVFGEEGTLRVTNQEAVCQRRNDSEPVSMQIPETDQAPEGVQMLQYTWNRIITDFCTAIRRGDVAHKSVAHLPTFADGLRVQEFTAAAEQSEAERRWVDLIGC